MPYAFIYKKQKLPRSLDRRVKITEDMRADILKRYEQGEAIRAIAREYPQISRRSIQIIIFPERGDVIKAQYKANKQSQKTYARVKGRKHAEIQREHRRYKQSVKDKLI